jgi:hypothetical protein
LEAEVEADASQAAIDDLRKELAQQCPVSVILSEPAASSTKAGRYGRSLPIEI